MIVSSGAWLLSPPCSFSSFFLSNVSDASEWPEGGPQPPKTLATWEEEPSGSSASGHLGTKKKKKERHRKVAPSSSSSDPDDGLTPIAYNTKKMLIHNATRFSPSLPGNYKRMERTKKKTRGVNSADADQLFEGFLKIRVHCVNSRTTNIHRLLFFRSQSTEPVNHLILGWNSSIFHIHPSVRRNHIGQSARGESARERGENVRPSSYKKDSLPCSDSLSPSLRRPRWRVVH